VAWQGDVGILSRYVLSEQRRLSVPGGTILAATANIDGLATEIYVARFPKKPPPWIIALAE